MSNFCIFIISKRTSRAFFYLNDMWNMTCTKTAWKKWKKEIFKRRQEFFFLCSGHMKNKGIPFEPVKNVATAVDPEKKNGIFLPSSNFSPQFGARFGGLRHVIQGRRGNKKGKKELWKRGKIAKKGKENGIVCAGEMKSQGRHFWKIKVLSKIRSLGNYNILLRSSQNLVEHNIFSQDSSSQFSFGFSLLRKFHLDICVHSLAICPANARLLLLGKHIT